MQFLPSDRGWDVCLFRRLTHVPCPTCGATRGVRAVLAGRLCEGWAQNPLVLTLLAGLGACLAVRLATGWAPRLEMARPGRIALWVVAAVALAANWAYVICVLR